MADEKMPSAMIAWMSGKGWGAHHDQWHFERRWDFWHALAAQPGHDPDIDHIIADAVSKGWTRSSLQEGSPGNGEDFLFMHRAMFQLLNDNFPQHMHFLRGWHSPPQDPSDPEDPAPDAFNSNMKNAIKKIEANAPTLADDNAYGLFIETNWKPTPNDPLARNPDPETGIHNYAHNRWSDQDSPVNLGDPRVNIFNARFWKLHGWIDYQWWRFRRAKGFDDSAANYQSKLRFYVQMMNQDAHHEHFAEVIMELAPQKTRNVFAFDVFP
ncbi:MAG: hypothetical protein FJX48_08920 [Alphaproteobacteria bacterium]|nr:hypothetical protein [Alphaproteobacteria bacterium]